MLEKTRWYQRHAFGSPWDKNICKLSFGYTHTYKRVAATSQVSVLAATASAVTAQTITAGITDPDVPRNLLVKPGGTAASVGSGVVRINGTNVEGKAIFEDFALTDGDITVITGVKAFKTVTSVVLPPMDDTDATVSVGVGNALGMNHRLNPSNTTVKVVTDTGSAKSLEGTAPTVTNSDVYYIEENTVTPTTTPDGTYTYTFYYIYDSWTLNDTNDNPSYITETSTSTSTSSTSTSTSSTSTSTTSTSTSTTSTSTSTTSTSTSTTTVP